MSKQPTDKGTTMADSKEMAVREKKELAAKEEKTVPGRYYIPYADIYETDEALAVVMEMPGVEKKDLDVGLENDVLEGRRPDRFFKVQGHGARLRRIQRRPLCPLLRLSRAPSTRRRSARASRTAC